MRFASLGSGSRGNALLVEAGRTRVLVDCGFGPREAVRRLARLGLVPDDLSGIVVTHEHSDHLGGVFRLAERHRIPVWLTAGTLRVARESSSDWNSIASDAVFAIGDIEVRAFPVPHDAAEPVQYVFSDGCRRLGVLTDAGEVVPSMVDVLRACDGLVVECNHDRGMLARSSYPAMLKRRITGRLGHLANDQAAALVAAVASDRLQHLVAAHLSRENNSPVLAAGALAGALGCSSDWIGVACQAEGFSWREFV